MMKNILDENEINIGDNVTIGQNVSLLCVTHPVEDIKLRNSEFEYAKKIFIGNVWIKGNVVILPGVVLDQLLGHPPCDVANGAGAAYVPYLPQGINGGGKALEIVPLFLLNSQVLRQLFLLKFAHLFLPE